MKESFDGCLSFSNPRLVGDPVDTLTGAVFDRQFEFRLLGPIELRFYRHYDSSRHDRCCSLGWGHAHDLERVLRFDGDTINFEAPVGRIYPFPNLSKDEDQSARYGFILQRKSARQYHLFHHDGPAMEFELDKSGRLGRLKRFFNGAHQILFYRDGSGRLECIIDSVGRRIMVIEESNGRLKGLTLKNGYDKANLLLMAYEYDSRGNLVSARNASGHRHTYAYDGANRLVLRTGRKGFNFRFVYDDKGRCIKCTGDNNIHGVTLEYKVAGRKTKVTKADGGVWTYSFDPLGNLMEILDPLGGTKKFLRDAEGRLTAELDQNNNPTCFVYNGAGGAIAKIDPLGYRISLPEDLNSPPPLFHGVAENPVEYEYGGLVDVEQIALPDSTEALALAETLGVKKLIVSRSEQSLVGETDRGTTPRALYGLWWPSPKRGRIFNDFGELVRQGDDFGRLRHWRYDASGNLEEYEDFDGSKWSYDHGSWHFYPSVTNPLGAKVKFTHTPEGEVASCTDAGGTLSEYQYDFNGHLIEVKRHGAVRERYKRDPVGKLLAKYASDGREMLRIELGPGNLRSKLSLASGDEHTFQYDKSGRSLVVATKKDVVEFAYDTSGNRVLEKRNGRGVMHSFGGPLKPVESIFFDRFIVQRRWSKDRTLIITDSGGKSHWIRFCSHGLIERGFSNNSKELAQFDCFGRCHFKSAKRAAGRVWNRRYDWSGEGELRQVQDTYYGTIRHEYDAAHRLSRRFADGRVDDYRFDAANNLIYQPGLHDVELLQGNRLKTVNGLSVSYNDRNHIAERQTIDGSISYEYDSYDQLVSVTMPNGKWEAAYDALGRRTRKTWAGRSTEFFWNDDQLIAEIAPDGRLRIYIYADGTALSPFLFLDYDSIDSEADACRRFFIFTDQIGTPCLVEDEKGDDAWRAKLEPFGRAAIATGTNIEFNLRFPGHYFDTELGLHYNRFRYYDPGLGRYLQSDPWGIAGGINVYGYRLNPLFEVDVLGMGGTPPADQQDRGTEGTQTPTPRVPTPEEEAQALAGHGHDRHGSQTTTAQQTTRVQTGVAPDGATANTSRATRFDNPEAELDAVRRAQARTNARVASGAVSTAIVVAPNGTARLPRDASTVSGHPGGYGSGVEVQRNPTTNQPLPGRPVQPTGQDPNAQVVLQYQPSTGTWEPVTQYPTNNPVTP